MAEATGLPVSDVLDDDQWLYGDEKDENKEEGEINDKAGENTTEESSKENGQQEDASKESEDKTEEDGEDKDDAEKTDEKEKEAEEDKPASDDADSDDSDEDGMAITIGPLKKQTDVIQAPTTHPQKFQPKAAPTAGLKDEDFNTAGKVNGVPVSDFRMDDFEDKPWRKPGADLSDYFNYGFNEETWFKYCERQKHMRNSESGAGLSGLGIGVSNKPSYQPFPNNTSIPVSIVNDNSKYGIPPGGRKLAGPPPRSNKERGQIDVLGSAGNKSGGNTIQVMTADRREYSNKIIGNHGIGGYDDNMDFGGNPYGETFVPPPNPMYYGGGGGGGYNDQGWSGGEWEQGGGPPGGGMPPGPPPPIMPPVSGPPGYFNNEDSMGAHSIGELGGSGDNDRQRSRRTDRSRSRSPSRRHRERDRDRHRSQSRRSRSRSPSHRHKRKKSKRERDAD